MLMLLLLNLLTKEVGCLRVAHAAGCRARRCRVTTVGVISVVLRRVAIGPT